jgi:plastocyanin
VPKILIPHPASAVAFNLYGRISPSGGWGTTSSSITQPGPTLTVQPGASVTLTLFSADSNPHRFCIDYEATPDFICQGSELSTESPTFSSPTTGVTYPPFTAPTMPGTYTYFCVIHGSAMTGQFIVSSPPRTPDFSIGSNPTSIIVQQGTSVMSTIALTSQNGFAGSVTLQTNAAPSGQTWTLNPSSVTLSSGGTATSALSVTASATATTGTYTASVTGTSGSLSHSTMVTIQVVGPDFSITASQTSLTIQPGSSATSLISIASQNGFSGALTLSTNAPSSGLSWSLNPTGVTLTSGATVTSVLTVNASSATAPTGSYQPGGYQGIAYQAATYQAGPYQAIVTATNGTLTHTATVTVNIASSNATAPSPGYLLDIGAAAVVGAIAVVGILWYRASRAKPKKRS